MPMYRLTKSFTFDAAHNLPDYEGKCQRLHGHTWRLDVEVAAHELQQTGGDRGMVIDFVKLKQAVQPILDQYLDHHHLNATLAGILDPITCETLAKWLYYELRLLLPGVTSVCLYETPTSWCSYGHEA
jgi:6-pyruvoyltetrahydropterin/6-carboxytetrahydropterin synthase